jgi:triacylglycerol lipase
LSIKDLSFMERSLLFANLASIAYNEPEVAKKQARKLGFTTFEFYNRDGAQAYRFQNKSDLVIACRGTQPTELQDLGADMRAFPVVAETVSRVHKGFKKEVDDLWPMISEDIDRTANLKKDLWFCGHSLGAAMATIMASRCMFTESLGNPVELYTFGSPRVGWKGYCNSLGVVHHRWKNNNDIVTSVPPRFMGFKHHGTEHYINAYGNLRTPTGWQRIKDKVRGLWEGVCEGYLDSFCDHGMAEYIRHIQSNIK